MDTSFMSCPLLTLLGVNNIRVTDVVIKNRLRKCTIIEDKQLQKEETLSLSKVHTKQENSVILIRTTPGPFT